MAATAVVLYQAQNSGPYTVGSRQCMYVKLTFPSVTYAAGGVAIADLEPMGFHPDVHQMDFNFIGFDETFDDDLQAQWDDANQKLKLFLTGTSGDPTELGAVSIASVEIHAVAWWDPQGV